MSRDYEVAGPVRRSDPAIENCTVGAGPGA
jgi:hypothetical protein